MPAVTSNAAAALPRGTRSAWRRVLYQNRYLFIMFLPGLLYFVVFCYLPMFGIVIAFQSYSPFLGFLKSPWVGFDKFRSFFSSPYAWRIIRNTLMLNVYSILFRFPAPIILALLLNELHSTGYRRTIQTVTYFPYFVSTTIIAGLLVQLLSSTGVINGVLHTLFDTPSIKFLDQPRLFRPIYIATALWQGLGFGAIIYLAAIAGIDPELYEAATMDGAGRWRRVWYITLPSILPTVVILFLLNLGHILDVGVELVLLIYNPLTYETADVIDTFVYRRGLAGEGAAIDMSLGAAVGLFKSFIGFALIVSANKLAKKVTETSLW